MKIEAIYIKMLRPPLITRDEYRVQELTIKYYFKCKKINFKIPKVFWFMLIFSILTIPSNRGEEQREVKIKKSSSGFESKIPGNFKNSRKKIASFLVD